MELPATAVKGSLIKPLLEQLQGVNSLEVTKQTLRGHMVSLLRQLVIELTLVISC